MDRILDGFLKQQLQDGIKLAEQSDLIRLLPLEMPEGSPRLYRVQFLCKGLVMQPNNHIVEAQQFEVGIRFNDDHLRRFDPTMVGILDPLNVWHPNIMFQSICVGKMAPGVQLKDLIHQIYEIVTYQNWASHDGLNCDAMQWARNNQSLFPVDRRPLKRRALKLQTQPIAAPQGAAPAASTATLSTETRL
jgi:ubiquitin-protein ligase